MRLVTVPVRKKFNREFSLVSHVKISKSKLLFLHFQNYLMNVRISFRSCWNIFFFGFNYETAFFGLLFICSSIVNKRGAIAFHQNDIVFQRHEVTTSINKEKTYCITVSLISLSMLYHIQSLLNCFARICDSHTWRERKRKKEIETEKERET